MAEDQTTPDADAAAADATTPAATAQKPEGVPDKFWNTETKTVMHKEWGASRTQLEQKMTSMGQAAGKTSSDALAVPVDIPLGDDAGVDELARSAGLDPDELGRQFAEKGKLTAAQYKALRGKPITREMINDHLEMRADKYQSTQEKLETAAVKLAGGDKQFETVMNWAKGLSVEGRAFYDKQATNSTTAIPGFEWLLGKYNQAVGAGKAQALIEGDGAPGATGGYKAQAELFKAQNDPRYETDKGYREATNARIAKTDTKVIHGLI